MKQQLTLFANKKGATISDCGKYRYWLTRIWNDSKLKILWIMLNPSTADENEDDPTIRRCIGFAKQWGYGGICVANLYAYRATDKTALSKVTDPVGQDNRWYIDEYYESNMLIVLAYGDPPPTVMKSPVFKALGVCHIYPNLIAELISFLFPLVFFNRFCLS